jgi:hypothetical protein
LGGRNSRPNPPSIFVGLAFFRFVSLCYSYSGTHAYSGCVCHGCGCGCGSFRCGCASEADLLVKMNQFRIWFGKTASPACVKDEMSKIPFLFFFYFLFSLLFFFFPSIFLLIFSFFYFSSLFIISTAPLPSPPLSIRTHPSPLAPPPPTHPRRAGASPSSMEAGRGGAPRPVMEAAAQSSPGRGLAVARGGGPCGAPRLAMEAGRAELPARQWRRPRAARSSPPGHGGGRTELLVWGLAVAHGDGADGSRLSRAPSTLPPVGRFAPPCRHPSTRASPPARHLTAPSSGSTTTAWVPQRASVGNTHIIDEHSLAQKCLVQGRCTLKIVQSVEMCS